MNGVGYILQIKKYEWHDVQSLEIEEQFFITNNRGDRSRALLLGCLPYFQMYN